MPAEYLLSGFLRVASARMVDESCPEFQNAVDTSGGKRLHGGQLIHPTFEEGNHCFHLGLLEHDFRNPDGVWVPGAPPGEIAGMGAVPMEQTGDDGGAAWGALVGAA